MKKGFTLIELLAVIVILAVIALISVPMILGVIDKAKINSFKSSAQNILNGTETYLIQNHLSEIPEGGIEVQDMNIKNKSQFISGTIISDENGIVRVESLSNGEFCANGTLTNLIVVKGGCDTESPVITVTPEIVKLSINDTNYDKLSGVVVTDNSGATIVPTVDGEIKFGKEGSYELTYTAIDPNKNSATAVRTVIISSSILENTSYEQGSSLNYGDVDWIVMKEDDSTVTLISKNNYKNGSFGADNTFIGSTAYKEVNTNFVNDNTKIKTAIENGDLASQGKNGDDDYYVRLINNTEINSKYTSNYAYWTMTPNSTGLYVVGTNGNKALNYYLTNYKTYYIGVSNSCPGQNYYTGYSSSDSVGSNVSSIGTSVGSGSEKGSTNCAYMSGDSAGYVCANWPQTYHAIGTNTSCCGYRPYYAPADGSCQWFTYYTLGSTSVGYKPVITVYKSQN